MPDELQFDTKEVVKKENGSITSRTKQSTEKLNWAMQSAESEVNQGC